LPTPLVIGVDAGGTTTRCLISTLDGEVRDRRSAGGANQNSSGSNLTDTLRAVLTTTKSTIEGHPVGGVVAVAGSAEPVARARAQAAAEEAWRQAGLAGPVAVMTDLEAAFAAGTPAPDGVLLIAGTGAVAARFAGHALARRADGYGWLAGDEGSAVWLGREAVRAAFRALDGRGPKTVLTDHLAATPGSAEDRAQALIAATIGAPPATLGRFAPIVGAAAAEGDEVARAIVVEGVAQLLHTLWTVGGGPPVVLGGGLLLNPGPVAGAVRAGVRTRFGVEPHDATDGAAGAAALAIARHTGRPVPDAVHQQLTGGR
jgi:N-acetylglucosamine kinase-like BadF-type ATPase